MRIIPQSFRRRPESRLLGHELDPGFRWDDGGRDELVTKFDLRRGCVTQELALAGWNAPNGVRR